MIVQGTIFVTKGFPEFHSVRCSGLRAEDTSQVLRRPTKKLGQGVKLSQVEFRRFEAPLRRGRAQSRAAATASTSPVARLHG